MKVFKSRLTLIIGGSGSFGKNFINYLLKYKYPSSRIVIFSRNEYKQDQLQKELNSPIHIILKKIFF